MVHLKKHLLIVLVALSLILSTVSATAMQPSSTVPETAELTAVLTVPVGTGPDKIQVLTGLEGATPMGPQSLSITAGGRIYLLDAVQNQVLVAKDGALERTISLPFTVHPRDLLVYQNRLYILDSNSVVYEASMSGDLLKSYPLPDGMGSMSVYRLAVSKGEVVLWTENYVEVPLKRMPGQLKLADYAKATAGRGVVNADGRAFVGKYVDVRNGELSSMDGAVKIPIETTQAFGSAMIVAFDNAANLYAVVEELADPAPQVITEVTLRRYDRNGVMTGVAKFPSGQFASFPNRAVDVTADGTVYLMAPARDRVTVYKVTMGRHYASHLTRLRDQVARDLEQAAQAEAMAVYVGLPNNRATTRSRAYQMTDYQWYWNPTKFDYFPNGTSRPSGSRPRHLSLNSDPFQGPVSAQWMTGIPYSWGGWDTFWSRTDTMTWSDFPGSLTKFTSKGPIVGNMSNTVYFNDQSSGVDCSGFVSAAVGNYSWTGGKPGTFNLMNDGTTVANAWGYNPPYSTFSSYSRMQPMDYFVNSDHVFMYDQRRLDGTGIDTVESTGSYGNISGNSMQGAKRYWRRWSDGGEGLTGYTHKTWWNPVNGDDFNIAFTATGSHSAIRGQGQYFQFPYSGFGGTVSTTVTANSGDPDIYVYDSSYILKASNTAFGGGSVSWSATANSTYYVMIHAYQSDTSYSITKSW